VVNAAAYFEHDWQAREFSCPRPAPRVFDPSPDLVGFAKNRGSGFCRIRRTPTATKESLDMLSKIIKIYRKD